MPNHGAISQKNNNYCSFFQKHFYQSKIWKSGYQCPHFCKDSLQQNCKNLNEFLQSYKVISWESMDSCKIPLGESKWILAICCKFLTLAQKISFFLDHACVQQCTWVPPPCPMKVASLVFLYHILTEHGILWTLLPLRMKVASLVFLYHILTAHGVVWTPQHPPPWRWLCISIGLPYTYWTWHLLDDPPPRKKK